MVQRYLAWRKRRIERAKQRPQIWDKSPTDWRYFGKSLLVSIPIGLVFGIVWDLIFFHEVTLRVLGWIPAIAGIVLLFGWLPAVIARYELDRVRRQFGLPYRPFPIWATTIGVVIILALVGLGRMVLDRQPLGSTDNFIDATGSMMGTLIGVGIVTAWRSGKPLATPHNRSMLDEEWRREYWRRAEQWRRAQMDQPTGSWTHPPA